MRPLLASLSLLGVIAALPASAQAVCGKRTDLLGQLAGRWQEAPVAMGLKDDGSMLEVVASADGSTWTLLITQPSGASCVVATGERWESAAKIALGPEA